MLFQIQPIPPKHTIKTHTNTHTHTLRYKDAYSDPSLPPSLPFHHPASCCCCCHNSFPFVSFQPEPHIQQGQNEVSSEKDCPARCKCHHQRLFLPNKRTGERRWNNNPLTVLHFTFPLCSFSRELLIYFASRVRSERPSC